MIQTLYLVALLAAGPALAGDAAAPAAGASSQKVTLTVQDASLTSVLENLATLIGVTPIISPGVGGTLTLSVSAPIPEILRDLEAKFQITIRIADGRMFVSRVASSPPLDDEAADRRYLADRTLPRKPVSASATRFDGSVEIRTAAGESVFYLLASPGRLTIPGCSPGLAIFPLPGDRFDGLPGFVLAGDGVLPRILAPALDDNVPVELSACSAPLSVRLNASRAGASKAAPLPPSGEFRIQVSIVEVTGQGETILSAPRIQVVGGEAATMQSGSSRRSPAGLTLFQVFQAAIVVVDAWEKYATVAVAGSVLRDVDAGNGGLPVQIRIAHARQSGRLAWGKSQRIVLAPTYGRGDSALVLDVSIERLPERK